MRYKGKNYSPNIRCSDVVKLVREYIKTTPELKQCKWSVTRESGTWTSTIHISLMAAPFKVFTDEFKGKYLQNANWKSSDWVTDDAKKVINMVEDFVHSYNYDNSDPYTDYFDCGFYEYYNIGKWDKPFELIQGKESVKKRTTKNNKQKINVVYYSKTEFAVICVPNSYKELMETLGGTYHEQLSVGCGWLFPIEKRSLIKTFLEV